MYSGRGNRILYFDYLRVFASLFVILLHVGAQSWDKTDLNSFSWQVFNFFDGISRWAVPVFVMISGALFLRRDIPLKKLYSKYILRLVTAFVFWSFLYAAFERGGWSVKFWAAVTGHYHLWFVLMLIGVYICMPLLRQIVRNRMLLRYFLVLGLILAVLLPFFTSLAYDFTAGYPVRLFEYINEMVRKLDIRMVLGFPFYFVLGYFLSREELRKPVRIVIYIAGIIGALLTVVLNSAVVLSTQTLRETYYSNLGLPVCCTAAAVFVLFRYKRFSGKTWPFVRKLSLYSFGVYLLHPLLMEQLSLHLGVNTLSIAPVPAVLLLTLFLIVVSYALSALLNLIPFVNRYFV